MYNPIRIITHRRWHPTRSGRWPIVYSPHRYYRQIPWRPYYTSFGIQHPMFPVLVDTSTDFSTVEMVRHVVVVVDHLFLQNHHHHFFLVLVLVHHLCRFYHQNQVSFRVYISMLDTFYVFSMLALVLIRYLILTNGLIHRMPTYGKRNHQRIYNQIEYPLKLTTMNQMVLMTCKVGESGGIEKIKINK